MTIADREKKIRAAIEWVRYTEKRWHDSSADTEEMVWKGLFIDAENKFGLQWRNVEVVLNAKTTTKD